VSRDNPVCLEISPISISVALKTVEWNEVQGSFCKTHFQSKKLSCYRTIAKKITKISGASAGVFVTIQSGLIAAATVTPLDLSAPCCNSGKTNAPRREAQGAMIETVRRLPRLQ